MYGKLNDTVCKLLHAGAMQYSLTPPGYLPRSQMWGNGKHLSHETSRTLEKIHGRTRRWEYKTSLSHPRSTALYEVHHRQKKIVTMLWKTIFNLALTWTLCARHYSNVLITALSHKHYHLPILQKKVEAEGQRPTCCTAIAETDIRMQAASIQILCITRRFYFLTVQLASRKGILFILFY